MMKEGAYTDYYAFNLVATAESTRSFFFFFFFFIFLAVTPLFVTYPRERNRVTLRHLSTSQLFSGLKYAQIFFFFLIIRE